MQIATWNVNSIRSRLQHVVDWLSHNPVDVLCLQETKVVDQDFPQQPLVDLGYTAYISGQKSYNGVALLSREPLTAVSAGFAPVVGAEATGDLDDQKRVITGVLQGVRIVNLYVPNGSAIGSEKYAYKLRWLALLETYLKTLLAENAALLVCGDFNIALDDRDIHDPEGKETHIMSSPQEREALNKCCLWGYGMRFESSPKRGGTTVGGTIGPRPSAGIGAGALTTTTCLRNSTIAPPAAPSMLRPAS
jgi:exodeoxyribonuclease-3